MTLATPLKTPNTSLVAWASLANGAQTISAPLDVSGKWSQAVAVRIARQSGTAVTSGWPKARIEGSPNSTGNDWITLFEIPLAVGASIASTTLNGALGAAVTSAVVTAATNLSVGELIFLGDPSTANWEIVRIKAISGTTITFEEATRFAHANGAAVYGQALQVFSAMDVRNYVRTRVVADNASSGQTVALEVTTTTNDSIQIV